MAPPIKGVTALDGYVIRVLFADGQVRDVDMEPVLGGPIFQPLKDRGIFTAVVVSEFGDTVVWPNGADLDPEVMYGLERPSSEPGPRITTAAHRWATSGGLKHERAEARDGHQQSDDQKLGLAHRQNAAPHLPDEQPAIKRR